jgi:hypothetical protein
MQQRIAMSSARVFLVGLSAAVVACAAQHAPAQRYLTGRHRPPPAAIPESPLPPGRLCLVGTESCLAAYPHPARPCLASPKRCAANGALMRTEERPRWSDGDQEHASGVPTE